jgi:hypothetical protein
MHPVLETSEIDINMEKAFSTKKDKRASASEGSRHRRTHS